MSSTPTIAVTRWPATTFLGEDVAADLEDEEEEPLSAGQGWNVGAEYCFGEKDFISLVDCDGIGADDFSIGPSEVDEDSIGIVGEIETAGEGGDGVVEAEVPEIREGVVMRYLAWKERTDLI